MKYYMYLKTMTLLEVEAQNPTAAATKARGAYAVDTAAPGVKAMAPTAYTVELDPEYHEEEDGARPR